MTAAEDGADAEPKTPAVATDAAWDALLGKLGKGERKAMELATANGTVSTGILADEAQITKRTASTTLKKLSERGLLERVGKSARDPKQFYRLPVAAPKNFVATPKFFGAAPFFRGRQRKACATPMPRPNKKKHIVNSPSRRFARMALT